jgi:outer membrane receptor protein involved in Fe transport
VGADCRDNGNTFRLDSYSTLDAFVSVRFSNSTVLTLTGRNLTNSLYILAAIRTHQAASPRRGTGACKSQIIPAGTLTENGTMWLNR